MIPNHKFFRYISIAGIAYFIDLGGFILFLKIGLSPVAANISVKIIAALFGFYMHRTFTFGIEGKDGATFHAIKYFGLAFIYTPLSTAVLFALLYIIPSPALAKIVSDVALFVATYFVTTNFIFPAKS